MASTTRDQQRRADAGDAPREGAPAGRPRRPASRTARRGGARRRRAQLLPRARGRWASPSRGGIRGAPSVPDQASHFRGRSPTLRLSGTARSLSGDTRPLPTPPSRSSGRWEALVFPGGRFILRTMQGDSKSTNGPRDEQAMRRRKRGPGHGRDPCRAAAGPLEHEAPGRPAGQAQAEAARMKDAWMRTAADFDNFRKRTRRELEDAAQGGREELLRAAPGVRQPRARHPERPAAPGREGGGRRARHGAAPVRRGARPRGHRARRRRSGSRSIPASTRRSSRWRRPTTPPGTVVAEVQPGYIAGRAADARGHGGRRQAEGATTAAPDVERGDELTARGDGWERSSASISGRRTRASPSSRPRPAASSRCASSRTPRGRGRRRRSSASRRAASGSSGRRPSARR